MYFIKKKNIFVILNHDQKILKLDQDDLNFCSHVIDFCSFENHLPV